MDKTTFLFFPFNISETSTFSVLCYRLLFRTKSNLKPHIKPNVGSVATDKFIKKFLFRRLIWSLSELEGLSFNEEFCLTFINFPLGETLFYSIPVSVFHDLSSMCLHFKWISCHQQTKQVSRFPLDVVVIRRPLTLGLRKMIYWITLCCYLSLWKYVAPFPSLC